MIRPGLAWTRGAYLAACLAVLGAVLLGGPAVRTGAVAAACVVATALVAVRLAADRHRRSRVAWALVVAGLGVLAVRALGTFVQVGLDGRPAPAGLLAVAGIPVGYGLLLAAAGVVVQPLARRDLGGILETTLVAVCGTALLWALVLEPELAHDGVGLGRRAYLLALVLMLGSTLGVLLRAVATLPSARPALAYLVLAIGLTFTGILLEAVLPAPGDGRVPWLGALWGPAYLAVGAASLHPARDELVRPPAGHAARLTRDRLYVLGAAVSATPVLGGVRAALGAEVDWLLLLGMTVVVAPLVGLRVHQLAAAHEAAEQQLAFLAAHDELTGLPNRRAVTARLEEALARTRRGQGAGVLLVFLDLDGFKDVNDRHGHAAGDRLLAAVAARLRTAVRAGDLAGRLGGDEFVVLVEADPAEAHDAVVASIETALASPVDLGGGVTVTARASLGSAGAGAGEDVSVDTLLSAADGRMYERKRARRSGRAAPAQPGAARRR